MDTMYFVHRVFITDAGSQSHSTQRFDSETLARKRFYSILAADIDRDDLDYELVQIIRSDGIVTALEVFDYRTPSPAPAPEEE